ncbi:hypothetical protein BG261_01765 [Floricoccus tropicus]|uniref:Terpene synthase n=1 Tax=Floricoccus tropicus TaxID=1859473 RepID=A0A1E8GM50_9LACT|nr:terpene synthase family protein [Floricoccus tropicus]OFI49334.1 hypothetical protein BG261_01765 [Floricoccus tropicus]
METALLKGYFEECLFRFDFFIDDIITESLYSNLKEWCAQFGIDNYYYVLRNQNIENLALYTYSDNLLGLESLCKFFILSVSLDDISEDKGKVNYFFNLKENLISIFNDANQNLYNDGYLRAWQDFCQHIEKVLNEQQWQEFLEYIIAYIDSFIWEIGCSEGTEELNYENYIDNRLNSVGVLPGLTLMSLTSQSNGFPSEINKLLDNLSFCTTKLIGIENDLLSLEREELENNMFNMVLLYEKQFKCGRQEAIDFFINEHELYFKKFKKIIYEIEANESRYKSDLLRILKGHEKCIVGNLKWSLESKRYGV